MDQKDLKIQINKALEENQNLKEFLKYAPIINSQKMLKEITENLDNTNYISENKDRLNVGLLAAKSLDFEKGSKPSLYYYGLTLYKTWGDILRYIGQPFSKSSLQGDKLRELVYEFYEKQGYNDPDEICSHMDGIDFNKSIDIGVITLHKVDIVQQWKISIIPQGNYYATDEQDVKPDCLGIYSEQEDYSGSVEHRIKHLHRLHSDVPVLKTIAAGVLDTWSVKGKRIQTKGGCIQYFNSKDKNEFRQINP